LNLDIGDGLGQWGFEYHETTTYYKPKMYGKKCKGVPKRASEVCYIKDREKHLDNTIEYKVFAYEKPLREREAIRRKDVACRWVDVIKEVIKQDDKRKWVGNFSQPFIINMLLTKT